MANAAGREMAVERENTQPESRGDTLANLLLPLSLILGLVLLLSLNVDQPGGESVRANPWEDWIKLVVGYLVAAAEISAAIVIGGAVLRGIATFILQLFSRRPPMDGIEEIRLQLGRVLALGLEFTVASDILRTAVAPTRQDILNLGAIVLLRTLLNYFLEREIRQVEQRRAPASPES